MREPEGEAPRAGVSTGELVVLATCAVAVLFLGIFPTDAPGFLAPIRVLDWARASVATLF
jgi:hypothetical protein